MAFCGLKFNEPVAISDLTQKTQQTGSEIFIMNLKTPKICAKRAKKCNIWYILNKSPSQN